MAVLQTKNLTLSPCCPGDRADFMDLERDPEVMRFLNGGYPINQEQSDPGATFLMQGKSLCLDSATESNGAFVGWFCLSPEGGKRAELGIAAPLEWARGCPEGASALINWGFESGGYDRIFACTMTVNHASRRVLEKIGLTYVRTVHVDWPDRFPGVEEGEVQYELSREVGRNRAQPSDAGALKK